MRAIAALLAALLALPAFSADVLSPAIPLVIAPPSADDVLPLQMAGIDYVRVYRVDCVGGHTQSTTDSAGKVAIECTGEWKRVGDVPVAMEPFQPFDAISIPVQFPLGTSYYAAVYHWFEAVPNPDGGSEPVSMERESNLDKMIRVGVSVQVTSPAISILPTPCKANQVCVRITSAP